jgi:hypothetical protein
MGIGTIGKKTDRAAAGVRQGCNGRNFDVGIAGQFTAESDRQFAKC